MDAAKTWAISYFYSGGAAQVEPALMVLDCQQACHNVQVGFYANLTQLVEHAVDNNDGRQVTIIGHSLGCLVSLYFIMQQPNDWLHKHVNSFIAISAPWAGSITAMKGTSAVAGLVRNSHVQPPRHLHLLRGIGH